MFRIIAAIVLFIVGFVTGLFSFNLIESSLFPKSFFRLKEDLTLPKGSLGWILYPTNKGVNVKFMTIELDKSQIEPITQKRQAA